MPLSLMSNVNIFHKTRVVFPTFRILLDYSLLHKSSFGLSKVGVSSLQTRIFKAANSDFQGCKLWVSPVCSQKQSKMYGFFKLTLLRCCGVAVHFLFVLIIKILTVILTASLQRSTNCCTKTFSEKYRFRKVRIIFLGTFRQNSSYNNSLSAAGSQLRLQLRF